MGAAESSESFDWEEEAAEAQSIGESVSVLRFSVGGREFAVPTEYVREIVADLKVTLVPGAPKHIRGVGMLRRQVVGVLDLNQWLDPVAEVGVEGTSRVVIVEAGVYLTGIEVSEVTGLDQWPAQVLDRSRMPETVNTRTRRYAAGIRVDDERAVVLLDVPRLLEDAAVQ